MPACREIGIVGVEHEVFHGGLHLGVDSGFDGVAAGVEHVLGRGFVHALLLHDVADHLVEQGIGEVAGHGGGVLLAGILRQHQRLGGGIPVIILRDHALLPHIIG